MIERDGQGQVVVKRGQPNPGVWERRIGYPTTVGQREQYPEGQREARRRRAHGLGAVVIAVVVLAWTLYTAVPGLAQQLAQVFCVGW